MANDENEISVGRTDFMDHHNRWATRETERASKAGEDREEIGKFVEDCGLNNKATTGPMVREAQRHLAQWTLQPMAEQMAEEVTDKLGSAITLDVMRPLQAFDAGGRARAAMGIVKALAEAKEAGVDPATALKMVDWE